MHQNNNKEAGIILAVLFMLVSRAAFGGDTAGPVGAIWVAPDTSLVMFSVVNPSASYQRCNESQRYSMDLGKPGGPASYQLLLLAKQQGYRVRVESLNTCNPFDAENIRNLVIE